METIQNETQQRSGSIRQFNEHSLQHRKKEN